MQELKQRLANNPNYLQQGIKKKISEDTVKHIKFTPVEGDTITFPLCGKIEPRSVRKNINGVDCETCLAILDSLALVDSYEDAVTEINKTAPKLAVVPDLEIMSEKVGDFPSRRALKHLKAHQFMQEKGLSSPEEIPSRIIGSENTFYSNMYQHGLINEDGETSGVSAKDLANGVPPEELEILE